MWRRWVIIGVALALVVARNLFPKLIIDSLAVWLLAIAAILFFLPVIFPYIRKIKIGEAEFTLEGLGKKVEKAQESIFKEPDLQIPKSYDRKIAGIMNEAKKDPKAAFLLLSTKIEKEIRDRMEEYQFGSARPFMSPTQLLEKGVEKGIYPQDVLPAFRDFWNVRNRVAHGKDAEISHLNILTLIGLGTDLLQILSARRKPDTKP